MDALLQKTDSRRVYMFDLDNTIVHTTQRMQKDGDSYQICVDAKRWYVNVRPGAKELLLYLVSQNHIRFGFWTAGTWPYAQEVIRKLFRHIGCFNWHDKIAAIQSRRSATKLGPELYVKDLSVTAKILNIPVKNVYLIDDNPIHSHHASNKNRVMIIPAFHVGKTKDRTLYRLLDIFKSYSGSV